MISRQHRFALNTNLVPNSPWLNLSTLVRDSTLLIHLVGEWWWTGPMAPFAGIDIQIISEGRPSKLHPDPDGEGHQHPTIRQRYVQATTGAQFTVKVGLNKDFNRFALRPDDAVRFTVQYDNQIATWYHDFPAPKLLFARDRRERLEYSFSTVSIFDRELQQWKAADICFGALEASKLLLPIVS